MAQHVADVGSSLSFSFQSPGPPDLRSAADRQDTWGTAGQAWSRGPDGPCKDVSLQPCHSRQTKQAGVQRPVRQQGEVAQSLSSAGEAGLLHPSNAFGFSTNTVQFLGTGSAKPRLRPRLVHPRTQTVPGRPCPHP